MKKYITLLLLVLIIPINVFAKTYTMTGTDVTIDFDDEWIVLTRDNLNDEELLASLNLTYDYMNSVFMDNSAYMDAFKYWDSGKTSWLEMFIIMESNDSFTNLNKLEDEEILNELKTLPDYASADKLEIYKNDSSKFVYTEYTSQGLYLCNFFTVINGNTYIFKFQSTVTFDDAKRQTVKDIMSTAKFDYELDNDDQKEGTTPADTKKKTNNHSILIKGLIGGLIGAAAGAVCGIVVFFIKKAKNKNTDNNENTTNYNVYADNNKKDDDDNQNKFINY